MVMEVAMGCTTQFMWGALVVLMIMFGFLPQGTVLEMPCTIESKNRANIALSNAPVHVGPGYDRAVLMYLNTEAPGIGWAVDEDGTRWWQLAITGVDQAWVPGPEVRRMGRCNEVQEVEPPPLIIAPAPTEDPTPVETGGEPSPGSGAWGACGSCESCERPHECVLSPDGQCLWDPGTCGTETDPGGYVCVVFLACDADGCEEIEECYYTNNLADPCSDPDYKGPCDGGGSYLD
jgi:hypothetical protein